jgi:hypothetical protein
MMAARFIECPGEIQGISHFQHAQALFGDPNSLRSASL